MIEVEVFGARSKKKISFYEAAINHFFFQLMPKRKNINIDLYIVKKLSADAFCTELLPTYFMIEIAKELPFLEQIKCLAHEVVHCKQYIKKQLQYKDGNVYWNKQLFENHNLTSRTQNDFVTEYDSYVNSPWEKEAFQLEEVLYNNFLLDYNI